MLLLLLLGVWLVVPQAGAQQQGATAGKGPVQCIVELQGDAATQNLTRAHLACTGGSITATVDDPTVLQQLQSSGNTTGVAWGTGSCGFEPNTCTLAICGSTGGPVAAPVNLQITVQNISDATAYLWGVFCIGGDIKAVLKVGTQLCSQLPAHPIPCPAEGVQLQHSWPLHHTSQVANMRSNIALQCGTFYLLTVSILYSHNLPSVCAPPHLGNMKPFGTGAHAAVRWQHALCLICGIAVPVSASR